MAFKFENLKIWKMSLELADDVDKLALSFPKYEMYSLSSQIKRAADSVCLNIVEGSTGQSNAEFKRFLRYSNRSALEVVACLFLAHRRNYIDEELFNKYYQQIESLVKMIQSLIRTL